jgi:hypothetical protein
MNELEGEQNNVQNNICLAKARDSGVEAFKSSIIPDVGGYVIGTIAKEGFGWISALGAADITFWQDFSKTMLNDASCK